MTTLKRSAVVLLLVAAGASMPANAQDAFLVMSIKGKVEFAPNRSGKWTKLEVGRVLRKDDYVRTSFASYAKILVNRQRLVSIDENAMVSMRSFVSGKTGVPSSATGKILEFAAEQFHRTQTKSNMASFGAVRGVENVFTAAFPKYAVLTTEPVFEWVDANEPTSYEFILLDENFTVLDRRTVDGRSCLYDSSGHPLAYGERYYWRMTRKKDGVSSDIQSFTVLPKDTVADVLAEVGRLKHELDKMNADEITTHLILGIYFEKKGLYMNAFDEYKTTVKLAPDVAEYRALLSNLLSGLKLGDAEYLLVE